MVPALLIDVIWSSLQPPLPGKSAATILLSSLIQGAAAPPTLLPRTIFEMRQDRDAHSKI